MIASGKGGTGKSTVTAGLAACLASMGRRVLVIDADIGLRNLDLILGMHELVAFDFYDVMQRRCTLNDAVVSHPYIKNLSLLAAPTSVTPQHIDTRLFQAILRAVKPHYQYIFLDTAAGLDTAFQLTKDAADAAILVANTELISLRNAARAHQLLLQSGIDDCMLILNRVRPHQIAARETANIDEAMDMAGLPLLGLVPEDETVIACANRTSPLLWQGKTNAGQALMNIAKRLDGQIVQLPKKIKTSGSRFSAKKEERAKKQ